MQEIAVLGIDLGTTSCSVAGMAVGGQFVLRRRVARDGIAALLVKLPPCVVAMEACCGAHHVGRGAAALGHQVRLMPPEYVRPYVKPQKNDDRDAEAIAEAATRPTIRFVPLKAEAQLDVQALHRARERLVAERTALINQMRALLLERGIVLAQRRRAVAAWVDAPRDENAPDCLSPRIRLLVTDMRAEWAELDRRIAVFDEEFAASARQDEAARRLATVPGIGRSTRQRWSRRWVMQARSAGHATWRLGSAWCRSRRRRAASRSCSGSPSGVAATCART
jgi:transposase